MKKTNPIWAVLAALLALNACAVSNPAPPASGPDGNLGTRNIVAAEAGVIAASHGRARRTGDDLVLTLANGKTSVLHNDNKGCADGGPAHCDGFVLAADQPGSRLFLIFEPLYEGGNFFLVDDRDGLKTPIPYWPIFSPDGSRFLILNDDVSDFFPGENLEIWRRTGFTAEREWIANPGQNETGVPVSGPYHVRMLSWRGDRITLAFSTDDAFNVKTRVSTPGRRWTGTLTHGTGGWLLNVRALREIER